MRRAVGFTLVEIMVALAVIAILASLAVPVYTSYVEEARRSDGMDALQDAAQELEQCYSRYGGYDDTANCAIAADLDSGGNIDSPEGHYAISASSLNEASYELMADPQGVQADDDCGQLTLTHTGERGADGNDCW